MVIRMKNKTIIQLIIPSVLMMVMMGTLYAWSVFRPHVESSYGVGVAQSGYPYMVSLFFYALLMMISGRLMAYVKPKNLAFIGVILIGLGWIIAATATSFFIFVLAYGVLAGSGVGMIYGVPISFIQISKLKRQGLYTGIVLSGFGMSPLIGAPVVSYLLNRYSLSDAMIILGVVFFVGLLLCVSFLPHQPTHVSYHVQKDEQPKRRLLFMVIYVLFTIATAIGLMMIGLSFNVGVDYYEFDLTLVTALISGFAVLNGLARPLFGWLSDRLEFKAVVTLSFGLIFLASLLALINNGQSIWLYGLSFGLFWFNLGAWLAIIPVAVKRYFKDQAYAKQYGNMFTAYGFGALLGVFLSGHVLVLTQNTSGLYIAIMILITVMGSLLILNKRAFNVETS